MKKDRKILKFAKQTEESVIPTANTEVKTEEQESPIELPQVQESESKEESDK